MKNIFLTVILLGMISQACGQFSLDVSGGFAAQSYNKVQIPNPDGTAFDLYKDFKIQGPALYFTLKLGYSFLGKNHFFLLYAPLSVNYEGAAPFDIRYQNTTFLKGQNIVAYYKFNSYRLTYRRDIYSSDKWLVGIGFTAKIRDAEIRLTEDNNTDKKVDLGFVPLLNIFTEYSFKKWSVFFEGDGLAGGPGRAFDFYLGSKIPINEHLKVKAAYRMVEGGADVRSVYNFTMLHFANLGLIITL
ncbi:MAG: hypothetical protein PHX54_06310 [Lentimicrobiaceae bacterium]|nr:hypothetical protein [Lentimicrobiaceae bacterium]